MGETGTGSPMFEQPDFGSPSADDFDDGLADDENAGNGSAADDDLADDDLADDDLGDDDLDDDDLDDDDGAPPSDASAASGLAVEDDSPNRRSASAEDAARAVLDHVTTSLVDEPAAIVIDAVETRGGTRFSVRVAPGDMGRVIGRKGRTVQALRTLVRAAATSTGRDASVEVVD